MTHPMTEAERIAAGLSEAQAIVVAKKGIAYGNCPYDVSVMRPLGRKGLFKRVTLRGHRDRWLLTKRGEAVRTIILGGAE